MSLVIKKLTSKMRTPREFTTIKAYLLLSILTKFSLMCGASLMCEELPIELCAYSISSSGARCVLEGEIQSHNDVIYKCQTSSVMGRSSEGWIESDDCMEACGLSRMTVGLSTDALSDAQALPKLCSTRCSHSCPLLFLLHNELAIADGSSSLEDVCKTLNNPHRLMGEFEGSHRHFGGHYGASTGGDKKKYCGPFGCGGGRFSLPPQTPMDLNHGGKYFYGGGGPRHDWKRGDFDPFFPDYPSPNSLPPTSSSISPSPSPTIDDVE